MKNDLILPDKLPMNFFIGGRSRISIRRDAIIRYKLRPKQCASGGTFVYIFAKLVENRYLSS